MPGPSGTPFSPPGGYGAGNTIHITVANASQIVGKFKQYAAGLAMNVDDIAEDLAHSIAEAARDLVPYDYDNTTEPHVQDNIKVEREGRTIKVVASRGGVRDEVPIYLEIGTWKMAARPFMKPAVELVLMSGGVARASASVGGLLGPARALGFGR